MVLLMNQSGPMIEDHPDHAASKEPCFFWKAPTVLWNFLVLCKQLPTFILSGFTSCMVSVNHQYFSMNKIFWNCRFTCEKARLPFPLQARDVLTLKNVKTKTETSKCFKCKHKMFRLYNVTYITKTFFKQSHKGKNYWKFPHFKFFLVVISVICNCNILIKGVSF